MSKKNRQAPATNPAPPPPASNGGCPFPAVATLLSWQRNISEEEARQIVTIMSVLDDPKEGKVAFDRCESPAERLFLLGGMVTSNADSGGVVSIRFKTDSEEGDHLGMLFPPRTSDEEDLEISQQRWIGQHRVDFCIESAALAIEIDGHEFHEKTKEQAQSDKRRDRDIARAGYQVIRFTGSEVYSNPGAVIKECFDLATSIISQREGKEQAAFVRGRQCGYRQGQDDALESLVGSPVPLALPASASEQSEQRDEAAE